MNGNNKAFWLRVLAAVLGIVMAACIVGGVTLLISLHTRLASAELRIIAMDMEVRQLRADVDVEVRQLRADVRELLQRVPQRP
jgi:hypothetical protein